jgi:hypothetical protein
VEIVVGIGIRSWSLGFSKKQQKILLSNTQDFYIDIYLSFFYIYEKGGKLLDMKKNRKSLSIISIITLSLCLGCSRTQHFEEMNGRWVLTEFPQYSFSSLNPRWEPHPLPTGNCAIFYGEKTTGTHIGVFLHNLPKNYKLIDLINGFLKNDNISDRTVIDYVMPFGDNGYIASCENRFKSLGANVLAVEYYVVLPTSSSIALSCSFKKKIEVNSNDFRREEGAKVLQNIAGIAPELSEFLSFCKSFKEEL